MARKTAKALEVPNGTVEIDTRDYDREIAELHDQVRRWREHAGRMRDRVTELVRENFALMAELEEARSGKPAESDV